MGHVDFVDFLEWVGLVLTARITRQQWLRSASWISHVRVPLPSTLARRYDTPPTHCLHLPSKREGTGGWGGWNVQNPGIW